MKMKLFVPAAICGVMVFSAVAAAQQAVHADADLQLRSGPGQEYPVVGFLPLDAEAWLQGCLQDAPWCLVSTGDAEGWALSDFLVENSAGMPAIIYDGPDSGYIDDSGYFEPDPRARSYVLEHPLDPVYLDGEIVVGEPLPGDFDYMEIPDYEYRYVYVNEEAVFVDPQTGRVVYIVR